MTAALYVHVPFCHSNCTYCDFYRVSYRDRSADLFLEALRLELATLPPDLKPRTIYVGGGTPSALRDDQLETLLELLQPFRSREEEYTFEVNPKSATPAKIRMLKARGVSRVSFGAQTFNARALVTMGRRHQSEDIGRVYTLLREEIPSVSFDLIFAHPAQTLEEWDFDLTSALNLSPDHLSIYGLTYEAGTPMTESVKRGELTRVSEDLEREMYLLAVSRLTSAGYEHYEVSSYSRPGHRSLHNQAYWNQEDYVGVGPGACSTLGGVRYTNVRDLDGYARGLRDTGLPPRHEEHLSALDKLNELLLLRLRTKEGLSLSLFQRLAGEDLGEYSGGRVDPLIQQELLRVEGDFLQLTQEGLCLADRVISDLMVMA